MIGEPRIPVMCDRCEEEEDRELTSLAGGGWDGRYVARGLAKDGWLVEGDKHTCPDCIADIEEEMNP